MLICPWRNGVLRNHWMSRRQNNTTVNTSCKLEPYIPRVWGFWAYFIWVLFFFSFLTRFGSNLALGHLPASPERSTLPDSGQVLSNFDEHLRCSIVRCMFDESSSKNESVELMIFGPLDRGSQSLRWKLVMVFWLYYWPIITVSAYKYYQPISHWPVCIIGR